MLNWIIDLSLRHRFLVILLAWPSAVGRRLSLRHLDIDAFPDTTPVQVQINTIAPAHGAGGSRAANHLPHRARLSGPAGLEQLRSVSKFGLSQVVVTFDDGTDIYFARQLVTERLSTVELPEGIERRRWGRWPPGWAKSSTTSSPARANEPDANCAPLHDWVISRSCAPCGRGGNQ